MNLSKRIELVKDKSVGVIVIPDYATMPESAWQIPIIPVFHLHELRMVGTKRNIALWFCDPALENLVLRKHPHARVVRHILPLSGFMSDANKEDVFDLVDEAFQATPDFMEFNLLNKKWVYLPSSDAVCVFQKHDKYRLLPVKSAERIDSRFKEWLGWDGKAVANKVMRADANNKHIDHNGCLIVPANDIEDKCYLIREWIRSQPHKCVTYDMLNNKIEEPYFKDYRKQIIDLFKEHNKQYNGWPSFLHIAKLVVSDDSPILVRGSPEQDDWIFAHRALTIFQIIFPDDIAKNIMETYNRKIKKYVVPLTDEQQLKLVAQKNSKLINKAVQIRLQKELEKGINKTKKMLIAKDKELLKRRKAVKRAGMRLRRTKSYWLGDNSNSRESTVKNPDKFSKKAPTKLSAFDE